MPPLHTLVSAHGFWLLVIVPPTIRVVRQWSARSLRRLGIFLTLAGMTCIAGVSGWELCAWNLGYWPQHLVLTVASLIYLPMVQVLGAGVLCWIVGARRCLAAKRNALVDELDPVCPT